MNYQNKKIWPVLIILLLVFTLLPLQAMAAENKIDMLEAEMDAILVKYLGATELSEDEVIDKVSSMMWDDMEAALTDRANLEAEFAELSATELAELEESYANTDVIVCFYETIELTMTPGFFASSGTHTPVTDVTVSVSGATDNSMSSGAVTVTAKGSAGILGFGASAKTATITIYNDSQGTATLSFDWTATSVNQLVIDGATYSGTSGSFGKLLDAGGSFTITITTAKNSTVNKLVMSNFSLVAAADSSNVTIQFDSGTVTVDGNGVVNDSVTQIPVTGATVEATATNFVGWIDTSTNQILSTSAIFTFQPDADICIKAIHGPAARFFIGGYAKGAYLFETLPEATAHASAGSNKTVVLANNGTLSAGNYTIPAGVTLLIPYNDANTLCKDKPSVHDNAYTNPSVYRALTMASGANITVNGAISVSGSQSSKYGHNSMPSGPLGFIKMNSGSKITVENGANLYVWGYITGSGSVEIKTGGTVHECFQIADYRGGDATSSITGKDDEYGVFPFNQYYLQNVEVPMTLYAGAKENGYGSVYVTLAGKQAMSIPFIGSSESMFIITSGYIVKDYMEGTGRTKIDVYGNLSITEVEIDMKVALIGDIKINTAKYALPIPHHFTVSVESGTITMNQSIAFLPGSELYIKEGATGTLGNGKKVYVYDLDQWLYNNGANGYSGTTNLPYVQTRYVPGGDGTTGRLKDALIQVDGTADLSAGAVYVTNGGANIYSTGTGVVKVASTKDAEAYQVITADTDISSWPVIAMQPAILQNGDDTDVATKEVAGTYTYCADTQKWCPPGHRYDDGAVSEPNCTEAGYTTYTCIACGETKTEAGDPALGHSWGNWSTGVCSVCDEKAIQFSAIQLSIESEIQLLLKFAVHQDLLTHASELTAYVTEEKNRIEPEDSWNKKVTDLPTDNGRYVVSQGIAAGEMTGLVTVQFKNGDAVIPVYDKATGMVGAVEKTVVSFAKAALAAEGEEGKNVALCKGALTFGGYAQQFYRTHTDNLAYSCFGETAPDVTVDSWDGFATTVSSTEGFSLIPTTQKINLDSKIDIRLYFEGESDDCSAELTRPINKGTATETVDIAFGNENGRVYLDIKDVPPAYWNDTYAITVSNDSESYTIRTSVLAWCARCDASATASDAQKAMARAMYHYANAADAYFAAKNAQ